MADLAGMICPHIVDWSMLLGATLAYGVMWPAIAAKAGARAEAGKGVWFLRTELCHAAGFGPSA